ncbi:hypothetical protein COU19_00630 [Candidatus Kaiserbacteria bacterium CG10_big_fil_rev_8_21_14_0_10_56_12]|uniref:Uncharacterized protein n=1 Tax=Candidatus Kaiserbacteria bacterium CG10_big_fil_rev_8_21_14_0_10_56_12 TaxID=1974611 RepID=A0A2H0UAK2_9BACT|nr:MAG: hypothetical protein COU19_00630 [Candidatus Kaiserbacteria bacterium CG10_big_fil_rev_8_21_14_0_10_56_12]
MTFGSHLALLTEENLSRVLSAVESDPEELSRLYDNFKKKRAALESDDASAWDNVIKEEEERLQSIEAS